MHTDTGSQQVYTIFNTIFNDSHTTEVQVLITSTVSGTSTTVTIPSNKIVSCKIESSLFSADTMSIGGATARSLTLQYYADGAKPSTMAKIVPQVRVTDGTQTSSWVSKGTYFIDTRETDADGVTTLVGYDAMLKTEQECTAVARRTVCSTVATSIASAIGVTSTHSSLSSLTETLPTAISAGAYTYRELLQYIAVMHFGNFVISDDNELQFVPLQTTSYVLALGNNKIMSKSLGVVADTVDYLKLNYNGGTVTAGTSGSDKRVVELNCPLLNEPGAEALVDDLFADYGNTQYFPYTITAQLNPLVELGDVIRLTSDSSTTVIVANQTMTFDALCLSDISAPTDEEINHEYVVKSKINEYTAGEGISITNNVISLDLDNANTHSF